MEIVTIPKKGICLECDYRGGVRAVMKIRLGNSTEMNQAGFPSQSSCVEHVNALWINLSMTAPLSQCSPETAPCICRVADESNPSFHKNNFLQITLNLHARLADSLVRKSSHHTLGSVTEPSILKKITCSPYSS